VDADELERLVDVAASSFRAGYAAAVASFAEEVRAGRRRRQWLRRWLRRAANS
jgi:hypothetical protein